jgi:hypothetical protein
MRGVVKPEFYRTPTEETAVVLRGKLRDQEQYFLQREEDWKTDLQLSMDREEQFRIRLRDLDTEVNIRAESLVERATIALSVEIEQHRQRVQMLEGEVESLNILLVQSDAFANEKRRDGEEAKRDGARQLGEAKDVAEAMRLESSGCDWMGCSEQRYGGWRFCKFHLGEARKELSDGGYLQPVPWRGGGVRTPAMMENVYETKNGVTDG